MRPAGLAPVAGAAACPLAALLATLLLAVWPGRADALAQGSPRCTGGNETAQLRCLLEEKDALLGEKDALLDAKDALIEALQSKKAMDLVMTRSLQAELPRYPAASADAPRDAEKAPQDTTARLASRRHIDGARRARDGQRSVPQPAADEGLRRGPQWEQLPQVDLDDREADSVRGVALLSSAAACQDFPSGWVDKDGNDCSVYRNRGWCAGDGGSGPGWQPAWGSFADFANAGHTAATACCGCRPPASDTGGRGCDYYAQHPQHCGCCDDEDFVASSTCEDVCSPNFHKERLLEAGDTDLSAWIAWYPSDTRWINLWNYGLTGTIPADLARLVDLESLELGRNYLTGSIPPELANLTKLTYFSVSYNNLEGTIPTELGSLHDLKGLYLNGNALTGPIPAGLGELSNLRFFYLSFNQLTGTIPPELGQLVNIVEFELRNNQLGGTVPPELGNMAYATSLSLANNRLSGAIPTELGLLRSLQNLKLQYNQLQGTVPPSLAQLANLQILWLNENQLTGTIPPELGKLRNLTELWTRNNMMDGTIPAELGQLSNLRKLILNGNRFTGTIPRELGSLAQAEVVYLSANALTGTIPPELGRMQNVQDMGVDNNQLEGTIPPDLGNLTSIKELWLNNNILDGTIPAELGRLSTVQKLIFYHNRITGTIPPELANLTQAAVLSFSVNQLTGTIPPKLGRLQNLQELWINNNMMHGTLPAELGRLTKLQSLSLYSNSFNGTVPAELGLLTNLQYLSLYSNSFRGTIPLELANLSQATVVSLSANQLTGTIPAELTRLEKLEELYLGDNQLEGTLPVQLGRMARLQIFRVGGNMLTGTLPREIGNLTSLKSLELHFNMFEGTLPSTLGNLVQLEMLAVYSNRFHGTVPPEMGALSMLRVADLFNNSLSGTLPREVGNWTQMQVLSLGINRFTGPVPKEIGLLQQVTGLDFTANLFTSLPAEIGNMKALQMLDVRNNPFLTGPFPDTSGCPELTFIWARNCNFTTAGAVGAAVTRIDLAGNSLTSLPDSWVDLPAATELDLSNNKISTWRPFGVLPVGTFMDDYGHYECGKYPLQPRLKWPAMERVYLSGNPFGNSITVRDFIWSFAYLRRLMDLRAASCGLRGEVPAEGQVLAWDATSTGDISCNNVPMMTEGYVALFALDFSGNNITSMMAPPPHRLSLAMLSGNALNGTALHPWWYSVLGTLDVWDNPLLRANVDPPEGDTGCPGAGATRLQADAFGWTEQSSGDAYQCTTLCAGTNARYKNDVWLNVSSLCRCKAGRKGAAINCSGCPPDTFSNAEDRWGMVRTCRACPPLSTTDEGVENATSVDQCRCPSGWYMGMVSSEKDNMSTGDVGNQTSGGTPIPSTARACVQCRQKQFQTTARGATEESQCVCNPDYEGLRALRGSCGCVDGMYMDHVAKKCRSCDSSVEECVWGASVELSLLPPVVKPGYWAEPWAGHAAGTFSENDIWRCVSKDTCRAGGVCAPGRQGRTCSLCSQGMYGGPDGACSPCPRSPAESRKALLLALLLAPAATVAAHLLLQGSESRRTLAASLHSLRTSAKQSLKYLQMLGVLSVFSVRWPSAARSFFTNISHIVVALPEVAGVACLSGQQTASLEMAFRWLLPVAGLASACLTALLLFPTRWLCRGWRWRDYMKMDRWDVLRVSLWGLVLFHSTVLQFGTQVLTCIPSPNGVATVLTFPHLECRSNEEWERLAGISCAFLAAFVLAVLAAVYAAWRRTVHSLVQSGFKSRGWWGFLFDDFRNGCTQWVMVVMAKDIGLVVIATAGAGDGPSQLLATATGATLYSYTVLRDQPFRDPSNNFLEAWTMMALASLSIFSAGMGYQTTPGQDDVAELYALGADDALYKSRARAMVALQWLTLIGPAVIVLYQIACLFDWVKKRLPRFLRPMDDEERKAWNDQFLLSLGIQAAADFRGVVERFDEIDGSQFRQLMGTSTATLGLVATRSSGIQAAGRRRMEDIARRSGSSLRLSASSSADNVQVAAPQSGGLGSAEAGQHENIGVPDQADIASPSCAMHLQNEQECPASNTGLLKLAGAEVGRVVVL